MKRTIVIFNQVDVFSFTIVDGEENVRALLAGSVAIGIIQNIDIDMFFYQPENDFVKELKDGKGTIQLLTRDVSYNNMAAILNELNISPENIL